MLGTQESLQGPVVQGPPGAERCHPPWGSVQGTQPLRSQAPRRQTGICIVTPRAPSSSCKTEPLSLQPEASGHVGLTYGAASDVPCSLRGLTPLFQFFLITALKLSPEIIS